MGGGESARAARQLHTMPERRAPAWPPGFPTSAVTGTTADYFCTAEQAEAETLALWSKAECEAFAQNGLHPPVPVYYQTIEDSDVRDPRGICWININPTTQALTYPVYWGTVTILSLIHI